MTLPNLLSSTTHPFDLTIIDNGSIDGTQEYLTNFTSKHRRTKKIKLILNQNNQGLSKPTNDFWRDSNHTLVGKIDNDILVQNGWLDALVNSHKTVPNLAVVGGFHFPQNMFKYKKYQHNIHSYNDIRILRQPYIGGNYIAKRDILLKNGFLDEANSNFKLGGWTGYQQRLTRQRYIIGYYFPFIYFEHILDFPDDYYKEVRGMSRKKYMQWQKSDAKKLLYCKWQW